MKYESNIMENYIPTWGLQEALREFGSNAFDAEVEFKAKATVSYNSKTLCLCLENENVLLNRAALLLGYTTKVGKSDLVGTFGEGLTLACLAAVRAGYEIVIRSGTEVWKPSIGLSKTFPGTRVLQFDIQTGKADCKRVAVEIKGINKDQWVDFCRLFLRTSHLSEEHITKTPNGSFITAPDMKGRIYVKGVFVEFDPKVQYGYDLKNAKVDRDRKLVDRWDLEYEMQRIYCLAANNAEAVRSKLLSSLINQDADLKGLSTYNTDSVPEEVVTGVAAYFTARYGEDAVPVTSLAESMDMEHLGKKGIVVPAQLASVLARKVGTLEAIKAGLREEVVKTYSWSDLLDEQKANFELALSLINRARTVSVSDIDIVDFRSKDLQGQWKDGRLLLASKVLSDVYSALLVLVHEDAHNNGGDGTKGHVATLEDTWSSIVKDLHQEIIRMRNPEQTNTCSPQETTCVAALHEVYTDEAIALLAENTAWDLDVLERECERLGVKCRKEA